MLVPLEYQVVMCLTAATPVEPLELEEALVIALDSLREHAKDVALGFVGGVDFTTNSLELEFTVIAISPAVMYGRVSEVIQVLQNQAGLTYAGSRETLAYA